MMLVALLSWIAIGAVIGAILVRIWKNRGLTLVWGAIVGGAGGSAGGLLGRMLFPGSLLAAPILGAVVGAGVALLIGRAEQRPRTV
ncbi:MAG TPA: hypothetical protein VFF12_13270 [Myxococcaceae bacterium]|nr:hypothetical protein [Myxococcaceae bacterium]